MRTDLKVCILLIQRKSRRQFALFGIQIPLAVHREIKIPARIRHHFDGIVFRLGLLRIESIFYVKAVRRIGFEAHRRRRGKDLFSVLLDVKGLEILVETVREPVNKPDDGDKDQCDCDIYTTTPDWLNVIFSTEILTVPGV